MNEGLSDTVSNEFVQILKQGETDNEKLFEKRDLNSLSASGLTKFNSEYIVDFRGIGIHPRFESSSFRIHDKIQQTRSTPIEYYEIKLYELCRRFNLELFSKKISLRPVELFHHIYRLKEQEEKLSQFEIQTLNSNLDETISALPKIFKEYELLKDTLSLISSLAVKWNAVNVNNYAFRMSGRTMNIKVLDLKELNSDLFTVETIWLATMIKEEPFSKIIDDQVAQYGYLLCQITPKLINSILSLNQHCNMTETTSIAGLVAAKKPKVARFSGVDPDYESEVVAYQRMKLKRGFLSFCIRDRDLKNVKEIKNMIEDFENVYRNFEESLMICILSMSKAGKEVV